MSKVIGVIGVLVITLALPAIYGALHKIWIGAPLDFLECVMLTLSMASIIYSCARDVVKLFRATP